MTKFLAKALSWTLASVLTLQPVLLYAQDIQVNGPDNGPRPHVDQAYNGTTVLNIGTPNGAGVSHDIYSRFSADDLILNNSATNVDTQLGGWIEGNPNLKPGSEAGLWIGEVTGGSRTELNGILEVGGRKMDVILANEYGVTCDGCGFINTDRATLTTGKPMFSDTGSLEGFDVRKGNVLIGPGGLNPEDRVSLSDTSRVDVIARAAEIYGKMRADSLNVIAGANRVDYDWSYDPETGEVHGVTEQAGEGAAPALAVDVAALGGMYANAIKMVATENGVGVRLDGKLASVGNIGLRSDGRLTLGAPQNGNVPEIKARKKVRIRNRGPVLLEGAITSEDGDLIDIRTSEGTLTFNGEASGGAVVLESADLASIAAAIDARNNLEIRSLDDGVLIAGDAVLSGADVSVSAAQHAGIDGRLNATGNLQVDAQSASTGPQSELVAENITIGVAESLVLNGKAQAADTLDLVADTMSMGPQSLLSARSLAIASDTLTLEGALKADEDIGFDARAFEATDTSRFEAAALNVVARDYGLMNGTAEIGGPVTVVAGGFTFGDNAEVFADSLDLDAIGTATLGGRFGINDSMIVDAATIAGSDALRLSAGAVAFEANDIALAGDVSVDERMTITATSGDLETVGSLTAATLDISVAGDMRHSGQIDAADTVMVLAGDYAGKTGSEVFGNDIALRAGRIVNQGVFKAEDILDVAALSGALENDGSLIGDDVTLAAATDLVNRAEIAVAGEGELETGQNLFNMDGALISGMDLALTANMLENRGVVAGDGAVTLTAGASGFLNSGTLIGEHLTVSSAGKIDNAATITGKTLAELTAATDFENRSGAAIYGTDISIDGMKIVNDGIVAADDAVTATAGDGGLLNTATLKGQNVRLESTADIGNAGTVSGGRQLVADAAGTITNVAALISGGDLALYADNILNKSGVIWANGDVTLAGDDGLGFASLVSNQTGRIEAFQGDLTIRADEVVNQGIAPTIAESQIIRWLEEGEAEPTDPVEQIVKLIDETYLDANGNILPAYAGAYAALWEDVINGGGVLSPAARSIVKSSVTTPSGTALQSGFATLWENMYSRANADGTPDPAALVISMVDPAIFAADGTVLPEYASAYADLWVTLASGGTSVSDSVKAILNPENALTVESQTTDPVTGEVTTVYSKTLLEDTTGVWTAMNDNAGASYDILKILYQDRFNDDGTLAEFVAGGSIDIEAKNVSNVYANMSAGQNISITADQVTNKALGATQLLVEVHKKPDCFTCHEGEVDYYDTFGGRIEAVGNVAISGNLDNITLTTSAMSLQDVIDEMNAYLEEQRAAGDPLMNGIPDVSEANLELTDNRNDDYTAPVSGNGDDIRKVEGRDTGSETTVDTGTGTPVVIPVDPGKYASNAETVDRGVPSGSGGGTEPLSPATPGLTPTKSVDELLTQGINTLAETNPEFTEFSNYITSNYMMDVDRLQYRDELINHNREPDAEAARANGGPYGDPDPDYLNRPVSVPAPDGSGMRTVYPGAWQTEISGEGALIAGENVTVSGGTINTEGRIAARDSVALTAETINATGGAITAEEGEAALTALGDITLAGTKIDAVTLSVVAGRDFTGTAVDIDVADAASIFAGGNVKIGAKENEYHFDRGGAGTLDAVQQETSVLTAGGDLSIITSGDLELAGLEGTIGGDTSLSAGGNLLLTSVAETAEIHSGSGKNGKDITSYRSHVTSLETGGDFTANAGGSALLEGATIDAGGYAQLAAGDKVVLAAAQDIYTYEERKSKKGFFSSKSSSYTKEQLTNKGASIAAGGNIDIIAEKGNLTAAGASLQTADGDIGLTAKEGDIYAAAYEDVFREERKKSKSMLFGLISSSSQSSSIDRRNTGTSALADLDLSLVSGGDTTLVGAALEAGGAINITTGGDFSVQAAIDSQRRDFFSTNTGLVLMTTVQENSFIETAVLSRLLAGQGLNLDVGGDAYLTLYDQAGVDAQLPEDLYPEELLALEGLQLLSQDLANEYFYDETVALSPAFKALVAITIGNFVVPGLGSALLGSTAPGWALTAVESFASSFLVESLDGMVSGDYDLGDILAGATFSAATAGLTEGIGLKGLGITEETHPDLFKGIVSGFGKGNLSIAGMLDGALDGMITSGLSSAVYGTDFGSAFSRSLLNTVVNLTLADVQFEIGSLAEGMGIPIEEWEGSPGHMLLHGLSGCAAAAASGSDCAAGAAGAVAQSLFAGALRGTTLSDTEQLKRAELLGAFAGLIFSAGEAGNVDRAAYVARSGLANNRQMHRSEVEWIEENADAFAKWMCQTHGQCGLSREQAIGILAAETLSGVSDGFDRHRVSHGNEARAFIEAQYAGPASIDGQTMFGQLPRGSTEYRSSLINADVAFNEIAIYELASRQSAWPAGQSATLAVFNEMFASFAEDPDSPAAMALVDTLAADPQRAALVFSAYGGSLYPNISSLASSIGVGRLIEALPEAVRQDAARAYTAGLTGRDDLNPSEIENAILNSTWGPAIDLAMEEYLLGGLAAQGFSLTGPAGNRSIQGPSGEQYTSVQQARAAANRTLDVPGRVQSRVNLANGSTHYTPLNDAGNPVASGWDHVVSRHFGGTNTQSQFTLSQSEVRGILQSKRVVSAPVTEVKMINGTPTYVRTVEVGQPVGTVRQSQGGGSTSRITVQTDSAGNLITAYPVP